MKQVFHALTLIGLAAVIVATIIFPAVFTAAAIT